MKSSYRLLEHKDLVSAGCFEHAFLIDVLNGLSRKPKELNSRYFYDERGSKLFQKITELPEYYLTNCEFDILQKHKDAICAVSRRGRSRTTSQRHSSSARSGEGCG